MTRDQEALLHILYHPVEYAHHSHLPTDWRDVNAASEPLLNYWLSKHYQLEDLPVAEVHHVFTQLIVQQWHQLPLIAHLLGGYLLRASLPRKGLQLFIDRQLCSFISLPLAYRVHFMAETSACQDTRACGAAFILSQCRHLPQALRQRFLLLFPATLNMPALQAPHQPDNINLFKMAINYANCFPRRTA